LTMDIEKEIEKLKQTPEINEAEFKRILFMKISKEEAEALGKWEEFIEAWAKVGVLERWLADRKELLREIELLKSHEHSDCWVKSRKKIKELKAENKSMKKWIESAKNVLSDDLKKKIEKLGGESDERQR